MQFEQTALSREMQRAIQDMGFTEMTEVQEKTIPEMMEGKDVIAYGDWKDLRIWRADH